jgi:hypothetical protein
MIYGYALDLDKPIMMRPETGTMRTSGQHVRINRKILQQRFRTSGTSSLGLLRTCKQGNIEAAKVFYVNNAT